MHVANTVTCSVHFCVPLFRVLRRGWLQIKSIYYMNVLVLKSLLNIYYIYIGRYLSIISDI